MDCYFCTQCGVRVMHRVRNADGTQHPTVSIKGGLVAGLDYTSAKHIFTRSAVVPIPPNAERHEASPPGVEGRTSNEDGQGKQL